jgi:putative salt-induced outer membrane protein
MRKQNMATGSRFPRILAAGFCTVTTFIGTSVSHADPTNKWESVVAAGVALTRGNSENFLATATIASARKWSKDEMILGLSGGYGQTTDQNTDEDTVTANYVRGFAQWNHLFTQRWYSGLRLDGVYDQVAGINYRFTLSPMAGYYLIQKPNLSLALEAGPSFVAEQLDGEAPRQYAALRVGDRFEYKFAEGRARLWQTAGWVPEIGDFSNWVLTVEVGIAASLTKVLELRLVANDEYDNQPATGRKNNDFKLTAQVGYKF